MNKLTKLAVLSAFTLTAFGTISTISTPSHAQSSYRNMSCSQLWHERNAIYARKGHCFKTRRGRRNFGRNCFPPYGRLSRWEKREVARIQRWEYRNGCR